MTALQDMTIPLCPNHSYHIFNRGINRKAIFFNQDNCRYFLNKYRKYMDNYWKTYSWVLMKNHFHLVIKVCDPTTIGKSAMVDFKKIDQLFLRKHAKLIEEASQKAKQAAQASSPVADLTIPTAAGFADLTSSGAADLTSFKNLLNLAQQNSPQLHHHLMIWAVSERFRRLMLGYAKAINKQQGRTGSLFQKPYRRKLLDTDSYVKNAICYVHHNPIHHKFVVKYDQYAWSSYTQSVKWRGESRHVLADVFDNEEEVVLTHEYYKSRYDKEGFDQGMI